MESEQQQHIGQMIKSVIDGKGLSITDCAKSLNVERRTIYNIFDKPDINTSMLRRISDLLEYDFFAWMSADGKTEPSMVNEEQVGYQKVGLSNDPKVVSSKVCLMVEISDEEVLSENTLKRITDIVQTNLKGQD